MQKKNIIKNLFYEKFLGVLTKKGKKTIAKKILDTLLLKLSKRLHLPNILILYSIFLKLNTFVEIKKISFRRSSHLVPFYITFSRRIYLALKWIVLAVKKDSRKISTVDKFSNEIFKILKNLPSESLKAKSFNDSQAFLNKANIHYRW